LGGKMAFDATAVIGLAVGAMPLAWYRRKTEATG
jgi:hypothetical protein